MGKMTVAPAEICIIPRGMIFQVTPQEGEARGYICENYGAKFTLPDRGPIGANCLANPRDFKTPVAAWEDKETDCRVHVKWCGNFYVTEIGHSPLDVIAWHGNYAPFKYDLNTFSPVGAVLFDHPDPSIFTVLTASTVELAPVKLDHTIAFMFETRFPQHLTGYALELDTLQDDYIDCWKGLKKRFDGTIEGNWD